MDKPFDIIPEVSPFRCRCNYLLRVFEYVGNENDNFVLIVEAVSLIDRASEIKNQDLNLFWTVVSFFIKKTLFKWGNCDYNASRLEKGCLKRLSFE